MRNLAHIIVRSLTLFIDKNAPTAGAAIAFYLVTCVAPIMLLIVVLTGFLFGEDAAHGAVARELATFLGADGARILQRAIVSASAPGEGTVATVIGLTVLVLTASGAFSEIRAALTAMWDVPPRGQMLLRFIEARIATVMLVLVLGLMMVAALLVDTGLDALGTLFPNPLPYSVAFLRTLAFTTSYALTTLLFAILYRVPGRTYGWRKLFAGAFVTTGLFQLGRFAIGYYLEHSAISALGAGGALIALLLWVYYSAMIFLFGAALMRAWFERKKPKRAS